jgi:multidrug resistance efflux pump
MSPTTQAASGDGVGANGQTSLSERVKGLRLGDQVGGAKSRGGSSWLPWALCLIMAVTWASFAIRAYSTGGFKGLLGGSSGETTAISSEGGKVERSNRPADEPKAKPGEQVLRVKGVMIAAHQIQVSPIEVSGRVEKLFIEEGKAFKKGQPLAELDQTPFKADLAEAEAALNTAKAKRDELVSSWPLEVEQADAQLKEAQALRDQYESDYKRYDNLRKRNGVDVAEKEYEQAKFSYFTQLARVKQMDVALEMAKGPRKQKIAAAEADVNQAQARFDRAKWRLSNTIIVAPVDGIILTKRAEIGNLVNALAMNANLNAGVCDMADLTDLEVDLGVQEKDIAKVFINQKCKVQTDAYPERIYIGRVIRVLPVANNSRAEIPIRVSVRVPRKEEGDFLRPQMSAHVFFFNEKAPPEQPGVEPPEPTIEK